MDIIRPAILSDIEEIVNLSNQLFTMHKLFDPEYYLGDDNYILHFRTWAQQQINSPNQFIFVADCDNENGKIIGFISGYIKHLFPWYKIKTVGHISFLIVRAEEQRKGIGRKLENAANKWFKDRNIQYIEVYTNEQNETGTAAWLSYGYSPFNKFLRKKIIP